MDVALLKSPSFAEWRRAYGGPDGSQLPYRIDHLERHGIRLRWTDAPYRWPWTTAPARRLVEGVERAGAPVLQLAAASRWVATSPATLAMFESEGNSLAWLRAHHVLPFTRTKLVIVSCWLAELLPTMQRRALDRYRQAYEHVDRLIFFSPNQADVYRHWLGMPPERLVYLPFGVDDEWFPPATGPDAGYVLAVGRDRGRDWRTLAHAARLCGLPVKVLCRPRDVAAVDFPPNVEVLGYVDRHEYRSLLGRARVVALATDERAYPTGQSVLLEAAAAGKPCVVTGTPAISPYLRAGDVRPVPPGDPVMFAEALAAAGSEAPDGVRRLPAEFTARQMWATVADVITSVVAG
jgi:glycosyltransferase involved in cell wall biosynthesis